VSDRQNRGPNQGRYCRVSRDLSQTLNQPVSHQLSRGVSVPLNQKPDHGVSRRHYHLPNHDPDHRAYHSLNRGATQVRFRTLLPPWKNTALHDRRS